MGINLTSSLRRTGLAVALAIVFAGSANARPSALTLGNEVRGEITSADQLNYNDGSHSKLYRFKAKPGEVVVFRTSGKLNARMALYLDGTMVAKSNNYGEETTLSFRIQSDRRHILAVSGSDDGSFGPFQLSSERLELYDGQVLTPDAKISDWTDSSRQINLHITEAGIYRIDLESDEFDAKLGLSGDNVELENDDGGDGLNSRLVTRLNPGNYTLRAGSYNGRDSGLYILSVNRFNLPEGQELSNGGALPLDGKEIHGLFEGEGNDLHYTLQVNQAQLVTIDLRSEMFDTLLTLEGQGVSREDDDGGDGLNSRLNVVLEPGQYDIGVQAAQSGAGLFQLSAKGRSVPAPVALTFEQPIQATLEAGIPDRYTFTVRTAGTYVLDMTSENLDSYLRLYRNGEEIDNDDDSGTDLNARITRHLTPGNYVLEASTYSDSESGEYQIQGKLQR